MGKNFGGLYILLFCLSSRSAHGDPGKDLCKVIRETGLKCSKIISNDFPYDIFLSFNDDLFQFTNEMNYLEISYSNITILPSRSFQRTPNLSQLILTNIFLKEIEAGAFEGLSRLKMVDLSNNLLQNLPVDAFRHTNVDWLSLQGNDFSMSLDGPFLYAHTLTSLIFRNCNIDHLPETAFQENPNLIHLDLSRNHLASLPEKIFASLPKLVFLDMSRNKFQSLAVNVFQSVPTFPIRPMTVILSGNPWFCDCKIVELVDWLTQDIKTGQWVEKPSLCRLKKMVMCQEPKSVSWNSYSFKELMASC